MARDEAAGAAACLDHLARILGDRQPALFLDYDGTLTPIVEHPRDAVLSDGMRRVLDRLKRLCTVAVVSGRDRRDVQNMVGIGDIAYAGSHGFDIAGPGGMHMEHEEARAALPALDASEQELKQVLDGIPGARVERKRFAVAVHYRKVADRDIDRVRAAVDDARGRRPRLRVKGGKRIFELQPDVEWHKGRAVLWLIDALGLRSETTAPVYLGDDVTDEDAFEALARRGTGILVSEEDRPTHAHLRLRDPAQAERFLRLLAGRLEGVR